MERTYANNEEAMSNATGTTVGKFLLQIPVMVGVMAAWNVPSFVTWQFWLGLTLFALYVVIEKA